MDGECLPMTRDNRQGREGDSGVASVGHAGLSLFWAPRHMPPFHAPCTLGVTFRLHNREAQDFSVI